MQLKENSNRQSNVQRISVVHSLRCNLFRVLVLGPVLSGNQTNQRFPIILSYFGVITCFGFITGFSKETLSSDESVAFHHKGCGIWFFPELVEKCK